MDNKLHLRLIGTGLEYRSSCRSSELVEEIPTSAKPTDEDDILCKSVKRLSSTKKWQRLPLLAARIYPGSPGSVDELVPQFCPRRE
jgi:hypothetical protein